MSVQVIEKQASSQALAADRGGHRAWQRLRQAVAEMNYASRRIVELQAPWITGGQPR